MTILSDEEITALCVMPEKVLDTAEYARRLGEPRAITLAHASPITFAQEELKHDRQLREECMRDVYLEEIEAFKPMISPFSPELIRQEHWSNVLLSDGTGDGKAVLSEYGLRKVISYGTSSYGYDIRLSEHVEIFTNINSEVIDPKRFDPKKNLVRAQVHTDEDGAQYVIMPPHSYLLGHSVEHFCIPRNVTAVFIGKSTYARVGVLVNCTPAEAGWEGTLVIEISNSAPSPMRIYVNEGISQALFFKGSQECKTSYADRGGKYMHQTGVTHAKV